MRWQRPCLPQGGVCRSTRRPTELSTTFTSLRLAQSHCTATSTHVSGGGSSGREFAGDCHSSPDSWRLFHRCSGLFLIFDEQIESSASSKESSVRWSAFSILVTAGLFGFVAALAKLTAAAGGSLGTHVARFYHFVLPAAAVCIFLVYREWTASRAEAHRRLGPASDLAAWGRSASAFCSPRLEICFLNPLSA